MLRRLEAPLDDAVAAERPITVRDLLTFRMGFGQMMASPDAFPILKAGHELKIGMGEPNPVSMLAPDEWIRRLGMLPLMHQPGEKWMYNTGSDVLGVLIARIRTNVRDIFACAFVRAAVYEGYGLQFTGRKTRPISDELLDEFQNGSDGSL